MRERELLEVVERKQRCDGLKGHSAHRKGALGVRAFSSLTLKSDGGGGGGSDVHSRGG